MGEFEGHGIPGKRHSLDQLANNALVTVISRGAMFLVAGILIWGFNRLDASISRMNDTIITILVEQGQHKIRLDALERTSAGRLQQ